MLLPFVTVLLVVGAFGAFLIVRQLSTRAQSDLNERLLQSSLESRALVQDRELYLLESVNLAANLQDMAGAVERGDAQLVDRLLNSVLALKGDLSAVVVVDGVGSPIVIRATDAEDPSVATLVADSGLVERALRDQGGGKVADVLRAEDRTLLAISAPVCAAFDPCVPVGAAVVALDAEPILARMIAEADGAVDDRGVALVDLDGRPLASEGLASTEVIVDDPVEVLRRTGSVSDTDVHTLQVPLELQGEQRGFIVNSLASDPVLGSVRQTGLRLGALLAVALTAIVGVGALLTRMILRRVESLLETNRRLGTGDLDARAPVEGDDELGELARGLNQMADQLKASHDTLEARVEQRTREVERLLRERTNFFASLSHELRTPLAIILSEADLLLDTEDEDTADTGRAIRTSAVQLLAVVNDILDLAKSDAGEVAIVAQPTDIAHAVEELRPTIEGLARAADISAKVAVPLGLPPVSADWLRLREILLNLIDNAVKYTPDGGSVEVVARLDGDDVEMAVIDSGIGIPPDVGDRLFEPFFRVEGTAPFRGRSSSGLGLALTRGLVAAHGGTLTYESRPSGGTIFRFTLPVADGEPAPSEPARASQDSP